MTVRARKHKWTPSCMWPSRQAQRLLMAPRLPLDPKILTCANKHTEWAAAEPGEKTQSVNEPRWVFLLVWHVAISLFCLCNLNVVAVGWSLLFLFLNIWHLYHLKKADSNSLSLQVVTCDQFEYGYLKYTSINWQLQLIKSWPDQETFILHSTLLRRTGSHCITGGQNIRFFLDMIYIAWIVKCVCVGVCVYCIITEVPCAAWIIKG